MCLFPLGEVVPSFVALSFGGCLNRQIFNYSCLWPWDVDIDSFDF